MSVLCALVFMLSFSVSATAALIPTIARYFAQPAILVGKLVWVYMLPYGICALIWGPLTRKFSAKNILLCALLFYAFFTFVVATAPIFTFTLIGRLGMGVFGSCFVPLALIIMGKEISDKDRPKYVGIMFSLSFVSSLLGVFLSGFLFWRTIYFIPAFLGIIIFVVGVKFLKEFDYRGVFKITYFNTFRDTTVLKLFTFIVMGSFLYHSIHQWLGVYLSKEYAFPQFLISSVFTISSLAAIFSESAGGYLASRFGASKLASIGLISMSAFVFFMLVVKKPRVIFFMVVLWGLGWAFNHVGLSSLLTGLPKQFLRDASSLNSSLRFFSGGLGAFWGGKMVSLTSFRVHFLIVGFLILILGMFLNPKLALRNK